jgi:hypothetical protein
MKSGDTGLTEKFWQRVMKERQEKVTHAILSEVLWHRAECKCVVEHHVTRM